MSVHLLELVAPIRCACCGRSADGEVCAECAAGLAPIVPPLCLRCGAPTGRPATSCDGCFGLAGVRRVRSLVAYGRRSAPARAVTLALKRRGRPALAFQVGGLLAELAVASGLETAAVTFVPAGSRARFKGFDHAELVARAVARQLGAELVRPLHRVRSSARQADVPASERRSNATGAFASLPVRGGILLVDDVFTTGATVEACALALIGSGATHVDALTWARTLRRRVA